MRKNKLHIALTLIAPLLLMAHSLHAEVINISKAELQTLLDEGTAIVDVRRLDEWNDTGIIKDSHMLTFFDAKGGYDAGKWLGDLEEVVASSDPVILICRSGGRTRMVSQWLSEKQGYARVYNVTSGILDWMQKGGETVAP
ncbi:MAG: rhodanese-like domain-containing protein [Granulosicoccaceae bacterium]